MLSSTSSGLDTLYRVISKTGFLENAKINDEMMNQLFTLERHRLALALVILLPPYSPSPSKQSDESLKETVIPIQSELTQVITGSIVLLVHLKLALTGRLSFESVHKDHL